MMVDLDIQAFYRDVLNLSEKELIHTLSANSKVHFIEKGEIIQNIGDQVTQIYFLVKGLLRGFFMDVNGREITDCFGYIPGTPAVSCLDLDMPTPICIEAIEDCTLISVSFEILAPLLKNNVEIITLYNRLLRVSLKMHWESKIMLAQHTATERYAWF